MLTVAEVEKRCGLKPRDEFARDRLAKMPGGIHDSMAMTGRTTQILVHAVVEASKGRTVVVLAQSLGVARTMARNLQSMCTRCDVDPRMVIDFKPFQMAEQNLGYPKGTFFAADHFDPELEEMVLRVRRRRALHSSTMEVWSPAASES